MNLLLIKWGDIAAFTSTFKVNLDFNGLVASVNVEQNINYL
jgi:hypothetical protein